MGCKVGCRSALRWEIERRIRIPHENREKKKLGLIVGGGLMCGGGEKKNANYPDRTGDLQMDREIFSLALSQLS